MNILYSDILYTIVIQKIFETLSNFLNPFVPNAPFLYPLKTENCKRVHWEQMGLKKTANSHILLFLNSGRIDLVYSS